MEADKLNPPPAGKLQRNTRVMFPTHVYVCTTYDWAMEDWHKYMTRYKKKFMDALSALGQLRGTFQVIVREDAAREHLVCCDQEGVLRYVFSHKPRKGEITLAVKALGFDPEALKIQKDMMEGLK